MNDPSHVTTIAEVPCPAVEADPGETIAPRPGQSIVDPRKMIWVMAVACGLSVANLYYNQPLLADMARTFGVTVKKIGLIPTMTQAGYALGLLLLVPLGDILQRRRLVVCLLVLVAVSLVMAALARNLAWLAIASLAVGTFTVVPQVLIPYTAQLTPPAQRGRAIGIVMCGLLTGILLSRTAGGFVGERWGWRAMYWIAAGMMALLAAALGPLVPRHSLRDHMPYLRLLASVVRLVRDYPVLRHAAANGSLLFAAFCAFWATLVFRLESPPFHYGSRAAGLFGVVGMVGAAAALVVGRIADQKGPRRILAFAAGLMLLSFAIFHALGSSLAGLAVGVIAMDLAMQSAQVANQTRIYALPAEIHSRINTAYMGTYFIGGAAGSLAGTWCWSLAGWAGVCVLGMALAGAALLLHGLHAREARAGRSAEQAAPPAHDRAER